MNTALMEKIKKHRADIIVISVILVISLLVLLLISLTKKEGAFAVVEIKQKDGTVTVTEYSLALNGEYELNGGTNVLVIENGEAYLNYSNCPDHTCENTGKIRYVGETIICLPNRLSITVKGDAEGGVDLVS